MTIEAAIADLQTKLLALTGMKDAPSTPPEAAGAFPFAVTYERMGTLASHSALWAHELVTLVSEVHVARGNLGTAVTQAMTFRDPFIKAIIADPTFSNSAELRDIRWNFGALEWNKVETLGYRFEIDIKVMITP
jgi:hypothetical protein